MASRSDNSQYLLRMEPQEKKRLAAKATAAGIPLSQAFRVGAERYLDEQLGTTSDAPESILAEFRAFTTRVENVLRDREE